nr:MAG TPA: tail tube protein [Caudoviricetes sp.]
MNKVMIKVGDKEFPCRLTMGAMLQFKRTVGKDVSQIDWKDVEELLMLMWCCVSSASRADNIEFPFDFPMFCDLVSPADIAKWNSTIAEANEKKSEKEQ